MQLTTDDDLWSLIHHCLCQRRKEGGSGSGWKTGPARKPSVVHAGRRLHFRDLGVFRSPLATAPAPLALLHLIGSAPLPPAANRKALAVEVP